MAHSAGRSGSDNCEMWLTLRRDVALTTVRCGSLFGEMWLWQLWDVAHSAGRCGSDNCEMWLSLLGDVALSTVRRGSVCLEIWLWQLWDVSQFAWRCGTMRWNVKFSYLCCWEMLASMFTVRINQLSTHSDKIPNVEKLHNYVFYVAWYRNKAKSVSIESTA